MWIRRIILALLFIVVIGAAAFLAWAWEPAIALGDKPDPASFDRETVQRGAELAALGNCNTCHTAEGGKAFAGGRPLPTPFGTIYATNITPDPDTGIGRWSEAAFARALREGVDRAGRHLYPAFPYDHFTRLTDDDVKALFAFMMTRDPVRADAPANDLPFPLNLRLAVAGWKLLFFHKGRLAADSAHDQAWNRGAYLADGLAHCGACHTPRNALGAERKGRFLAGGSAEGWHAPALNADSPAPVPWTADSLFAYLRTGFDALHGAAAGPMAPVTHNLALSNETDVKAIATYVASVAGPPTAEHVQKADALTRRLKKPARETVGAAKSEGQSDAALFAGACATCHSETQLRGAAGAINLALSTALNAPDPRNAIHLVLNGIQPRDGRSGPLMPGFNGALTDDQIAQVLAYARQRFSTQPAWSDLTNRVRRMRDGKDQS
jgi:mono/diheme cytochrome c family protein